jgi:hypothetical protein
MAQKKFTQLTPGTAPTGQEIAAAVQGGSSVSLTVDQITNAGFIGAYDLSITNDYPTTGGTGLAGIPSPGNEWFVSVAGTLDINGLGVTPVEYGALLKYLGGAVGTPSSWKVTQ